MFPWLPKRRENRWIEGSACKLELRSQPEDNVRVYIPLDINENAILRRLHHIFWKYGDVSEATRLRFAAKWKPWSLKWRYTTRFGLRATGIVETITAEKLRHSCKRLCSWLMEHPGCGERFPMDLVEELRREYQLCFDE